MTQQEIDQIKARQRLLDAAPDLLAACEACIALFRNWPDSTEDAAAIAEANTLLVAALSKAEGRQP